MCIQIEADPGPPLNENSSGRSETLVTPFLL